MRPRPGYGEKSYSGSGRLGARKALITGGDSGTLDVEHFGENTPLRRAGQPAEMAPIYVLLASAESSYVTGMVYGATGGQLLPRLQEGNYCRSTSSCARRVLARSG